MPIHKKKRKFEMVRQPAMTKLEKKKISVVRGRGSNLKHRAIKLYFCNYTWQSESVSFKIKILNTVYNATNNELTRTKTLVKNTIVQINSTLFRNWYLQHYGIDLSGKEDTIKRSGHSKTKLKTKQEKRTID
ncbi:unnamed protein product [Moneuplotes crassus]|uniref:40S ribosomal protein S8 n=1 Tax=Euplotes crassus TaxID=5936 RepID=A0AAD2D3E3_EUPCR|nr:unnamed protein product [Moneuplotes crassus]